jgi:hypothetical protein
MENVIWLHLRLIFSLQQERKTHAAFFLSLSFFPQTLRTASVVFFPKKFLETRYIMIRATIVITIMATAITETFVFLLCIGSKLNSKINLYHRLNNRPNIKIIKMEIKISFTVTLGFVSMLFRSKIGVVNR